MPVVRTSEGLMGPGNRPEWCRVTAAGRFTVPARGGRFDRHYHDCAEYWLIYQGQAKVMTEGIEYLVGPGDIVCTEAGQEHDVVQVYEDLGAFFFEDELRIGGTSGHLHCHPSAAGGHEVWPGAPAGTDREQEHPEGEPT
jgi:hypothetical protein